ncbi:MAG: Membrane transport protein [Syntrophaceae bacterium PtaB.Bin038]|nr:MAG: Membrane transport protein [Syntrophaceae bacterium PtaB.Bin038]
MIVARLLTSFAVILAGLALGYAVQVLATRGLIRLPVPLDALRRGLQRGALLFVNPVAIVGATWIVTIRDPALAALPLVGLFAIVSGGVLALGAARLLRLPPKKTGALFCCGSFTNIGSIGALVCYLYLGEPGFALVPIYKIFEELSYYSTGFPIAKHYSGSITSEGRWDRVKGLVRDPLILVSVSALLLGGALNASGLERPAVYGNVNAVFIPLGAFMLLISVGLALRFRRVGDYLREAAAVAAIKFAAVPALACSLAFALGFGSIDGGLPLKVVLILSSMPVAFNALIPPSIYDLDLDLANSCWFVTTALLALVLPVLLFAVQSF